MRCIVWWSQILNSSPEAGCTVAKFASRSPPLPLIMHCYWRVAQIPDQPSSSPKSGTRTSVQCRSSASSDRPRPGLFPRKRNAMPNNFSAPLSSSWLALVSSCLENINLARDRAAGCRKTVGTQKGRRCRDRPPFHLSPTRTSGHCGADCRSLAAEARRAKEISRAFSSRLTELS